MPRGGERSKSRMMIMMKVDDNQYEMMLMMKVDDNHDGGC